jgi:hypothetical protein
MKNKLIIIMLAVCFSLAIKVSAQTNVKRFCVISFYSRNKFLLIDYGKINKIDPFKDSNFIKKLNMVKRIDNLIKGLNYMSDLGWKFESNISYGTGTGILLSRDFSPNELNDTSSEMNFEDSNPKY